MRALACLASALIACSDGPAGSGSPLGPPADSGSDDDALAGGDTSRSDAPADTPQDSTRLSDSRSDVVQDAAELEDSADADPADAPSGDGPSDDAASGDAPPADGAPGDIDTSVGGDAGAATDAPNADAASDAAGDAPDEPDAGDAGPEVVDGECAQALDPCTVDSQAGPGGEPGAGSQAGAGWVCVDDWDGDAAGVCRVRCGDATSSSCGPGRACVARDEAGLGWCAPATCSSFYASEAECGPGMNCIVSSTFAVCLAAGPGGLSASCAGNVDCGPGLICLDAACTPPECSATTDDAPCPGAAQACDPLTYGDGSSGELGTCDDACVPFVDGSEGDPGGGGATGQGACAAEEFCYPRVVDAEGALVGVCDPSGGGATPVGGDCATATCVDAAVCLDTSDPEPTSAGALTGGGAPTGEAGGPMCHALCWSGAAPGEPGACEVAGDQCAPLFVGEDRILVGFCRPGCTPFASPADPDPAAPDANRCDAGQWCVPDFTELSLGKCEDIAGTAAVDDPCGALDGACCQGMAEPGCAESAEIATCTCDLDPYCCDTSWDDVCVRLARDSCAASCTLPPDQACGADLLCIDDQCALLCDPAAPPRDAATPCPEGDACGALNIGGADLPLGICQQACDRHATDVSCSDPAQYCQWGELISSSSDLCIDIPPSFAGDPNGLAPQSPCDIDAPPNALCGPGRACLPRPDDPTLRCTPLCATAEAPLGATPHPDCPDPTDTCTPLSPEITTHGRCSP